MKLLLDASPVEMSKDGELIYTSEHRTLVVRSKKLSPGNNGAHVKCSIKYQQIANVPSEMSCCKVTQCGKYNLEMFC